MVHIGAPSRIRPPPLNHNRLTRFNIFSDGHSERAAIVEFDITKHGVLVEHILVSHALYIQAGKSGDRLIYDLNVPKMLVEVPDTGFRFQWDKIYMEDVTKLMIKGGLSRKEAGVAARNYITKIREIAQFKIK